MIDRAAGFLRRFPGMLDGLILLRLALIALAFFSVERGAAEAAGDLRPGLLPFTALFALLVGWLLGRSRLPGWGCGLIVLAGGLVWLILQGRQIGPPLAALSKLIQGMPGIGSRIMAWFRAVGSGGIVTDIGISSLAWLLAVWFVSAWAAWWLRRRAAVAIALLPATSLLAFGVYYSHPSDGVFLLALTGGSWIMLQALDSYSKSRRRWQARQMQQVEIEPWLAGVVVLITVGLMLSGSVVPTLSFNQLSQNLRDQIQNRPGQTLAGSPAPQSISAANAGGGIAGIGLANLHAIGPGPRLTQDVVMVVSVDGYQPPSSGNEDPARPALRFYWRSQVFDAYNGHAWIANSSFSQEMPANAPYHPEQEPLPGNYTLIRQHVERLLFMDGALFASGDLLSADQPSIAEWRTAGDLTYAARN